MYGENACHTIFIHFQKILEKNQTISAAYNLPHNWHSEIILKNFFQLQIEFSTQTNIFQKFFLRAKINFLCA